MKYYLVLLDRNEYVKSYDFGNHSVGVTDVKNDAKRFINVTEACWIADRVAGFIETIDA